MPEGLYESDALAWAEHQADVLRRLAAGERVSDAVDWARVIEEVANLGLSELRACQGLLVQAMSHLLKLHLDPAASAAVRWRGEVVTFLANAARVFTPSMRRRLVPDALWADALRRIRAEAPGNDGVPATAPEACPFALDDLLDARLEVMALVGRVAPPRG